MPLYEYTCEKCGQTLEVIQKLSDPDLEKHEDCGGALTKLLSIPGFKFSGGSESKHPSEYQQSVNEIKSKESAKKSPKIVSTPAGGKTHSA
jgi:putative FmdB family regulatory protein